MDTKKEELYFVHNTPVPETPAPGQKPEPWQQTQMVGQRRARVDGYERVSGTAAYPSDVILPKMLYAAILRCPHPHATVKKVDTSAAVKMPGVHAVISGMTPATNPVWNYRTWEGHLKKSKLFDPHCRFEGDTVAAVAAETPYQAQDALRNIDVTYDVLPYVSDYRKALDTGTPNIHAEGNQVGQPQTQERGDVAQGFAEADVVLEETYYTACEIHTPLELHGCLANWDGDRLTVWESTQGVYAVQATIAEVLELPLSKVRVIGHYMGGGFGSKGDTSKYSIIAALLAQKTGRPVKLFLTREETYLATGNRPSSYMTLKAGVKKDGRLTAMEFTAIGASGAYPAGGTSLLDWLIKDLYTCPNVRTHTTDVYINAGPARPFRAPGHPQCAWALEQMMDALAEAIAMDPIKLRLQNIPDFSQARPGNPPYTTTGYKQCLEEGATQFGWQQLREKYAANKKDGNWLRGVGVAGSSWFLGNGFGPATIILKLYADGSVNLNMGASDIGTGTKTIMAMVVAEELGIKPEAIQIEHADTGTTQFASVSGGSKTVPTEAPAVRDAAITVKRRLLEMAAEDLKSKPTDLALKDGKVFIKNNPAKAMPITAVAKLKQHHVIVGVGNRGPRPTDKTVIPFAAQFCEVAVNAHTGEVQILRFLGAHDSGRVMNRLTYDNQVFGGITMGIGLATTEKRVLDHNHTGKMVNRSWHEYKLPTSLDVPANMQSVPIEIPDDVANTTGAKGLGEPVTIPTAAVVANAIYNATGIRVTETPVNAVQLSQLLAQHRKEG